MQQRQLCYDAMLNTLDYLLQVEGSTLYNGHVLQHDAATPWAQYLGSIEATVDFFLAKGGYKA